MATIRSALIVSIVSLQHIFLVTVHPVGALVLRRPIDRNKHTGQYDLFLMREVKTIAFQATSKHSVLEFYPFFKELLKFCFPYKAVDKLNYF
jgi:hypothetical protein